MNFKIFAILFFVFISCGLKTNPKEPPGTRLPSVIEGYSYKSDAKKKKIELEEEAEKKDQKKKPVEEVNQ